jgi:hypothetical protein
MADVHSFGWTAAAGPQRQHRVVTFATGLPQPDADYEICKSKNGGFLRITADRHFLAKTAPKGLLFP